MLLTFIVYTTICLINCVKSASNNNELSEMLVNISNIQTDVSPLLGNLSSLVSFNSNDTNTGVNLTTTTTTTTTTTLSPRSTRITTVDYVEEILKRKETNLNKIFELLRKEQANRCVYGKNPLLADLCPNLFDSTSKEPTTGNSVNEIYKNLTIDDVYNLLIKKDVVKKLTDSCTVGEWCLEEDVMNAYSVQNQTDSSDLFCLIESCSEPIKFYLDKCTDFQITKDVINIAPLFCQSNLRNYPNQYCAEQTLRLVHISAAVSVLSEEKVIDKDICENDIYDRTCSDECKKMALSLDRLLSCCGDTKLIKKFRPFNWFFYYNHEISLYCDLPIKTICWSDGKYSFGISPEILVLSIILTIVLTALVILISYIYCCRRRKMQQPYGDLYEYAHLDPNGDEEVSLAHSSFNEEFFGESYKKTSMSNMLLDGDDRSTEVFDLNNNKNISRFVNKQQTDIINLITS